MKKNIIITLLFCVSILFTSCRKDAVIEPGSGDTEQTSFFIKISTSSIPEEVNIIIGKLERDGFGTLVEQFEENNGYVQADFNKVFIGAWHLSVTAFTKDNDPVYFGEADLYVTTGTNQVTLTLNPVTGNLEVTIEFNTPNKDSLLASYPFNGNAIDESGHGNNGSIHGAELCADRFGKPNSAYYFNGIDDYIEIADADILTPSNQKLSVSLWINSFGLKNRFFLYKGSSTANREYAFGVHSNGMASFQVNNEGLQYSRGNVFTIDTLKNEKWYHLTGTWDGNQFKIYLNGEINNLINYRAFITNQNSSLFIGTYGGDIPAYDFYGMIDDIKIFNKVLTSEEIKELYTLKK